MFEGLSQAERMLLLEFVCACAWADLEIQESESKFIGALMNRLKLDPGERAQVDAWLSIAPSPESVGALRVPAAHKQLFLDSVQGMAESDGVEDPDERAHLDRFRAGLGL